MLIAIGSDHGGFLIKEQIKKYLEQNKISYNDFGTNSEESVDYPVFARKVAQSVARGECELGILCCGTGIGVSIAANKIKGIRAALCNDEFCAEMARKHNNANVMCVGGRIVDTDKVLPIVKKFLNTPFEGGRHQKRLDEISEIVNI